MDNYKDDTYYVNMTSMSCQTCEELRSEITILRHQLRQMVAAAADVIDMDWTEESEHDD